MHHGVFSWNSTFIVKCAWRCPFEMSEFQNRNQSRVIAHHRDYVWQYEYYDDEVPVSFEGLRAHRYSIVIGFWVGLAVFVIFMFFVLTLLTKTGAPHQEIADQPLTRHRQVSRLADIPKDDAEKALSHPLLAEPHQFFHFYISEEEQAQRQSRPGQQRVQSDQVSTRSQQDDGGGGGTGSSGIKEMLDEELKAEELRSTQGMAREELFDRESTLMTHFDIPNFVNSEQSSTLGEDDLLLCKPTLQPENQRPVVHETGSP